MTEIVELTHQDRERVTPVLVIFTQLREQALERQAMFLFPADLLPGCYMFYGRPVLHLPIPHAMVAIDPPVGGRVLSSHERGPRPGHDDQRGLTDDDYR